MQIEDHDLALYLTGENSTEVYNLDIMDDPDIPVSPPPQYPWERELADYPDMNASFFAVRYPDFLDSDSLSLFSVVSNKTGNYSFGAIQDGADSNQEPIPT